VVKHVPVRAVAPTIRGYLIEVHSGGSGQVSRSWELTPKPASAGTARALARSACQDWQAEDEACEDALLIASELVANVVDHAGTHCTLTLSLDGEGLRIEVRDFYRCPPPRARPINPAAPRGRGLQLVSVLAARWGVTEFDDGKSVWAVLWVPSSAPVPTAG
jgi:anti-sigma regulatory factor (Ser/Thr protein kinase)